MPSYRYVIAHAILILLHVLKFHIQSDLGGYQIVHVTASNAEEGGVGILFTWRCMLKDFMVLKHKTDIKQCDRSMTLQQVKKES